MPGPDAPLAALEALIFSSETPVAPGLLKRVLGLTPGQVSAGVKDINAALDKGGRPYEIVEIAGGYQFRTRPEFGEMLASAQPERKTRLSRAALDTLAVVAYRQPISRPEIEEIRSVDCGAVLRSLIDREFVRIVGRRDAPGRPALYGTSAHFLEAFGLGSLRDLPDLRELVTETEAQATPLEEAIARGQRNGSLEDSREGEDGLEPTDAEAEDRAADAAGQSPAPETEPDADEEAGEPAESSSAESSAPEASAPESSGGAELPRNGESASETQESVVTAAAEADGSAAAVSGTDPDPDTDVGVDWDAAVESEPAPQEPSGERDDGKRPA